VLLSTVAVISMVRGVAVSTKLAGLFFGVEMLVFLVVTIVRHGA